MPKEDIVEIDGIKIKVLDESEDYIRTGQCKRCGRCCDMRRVFRGLIENATEEEIKARLSKLGKGVRYCPYLKWSKQESRGPGRKWKKVKIAFCTIYDKRPPACSEYPSGPADKPPRSCGFSFSAVEPLKKEKRLDMAPKSS